MKPKRLVLFVEGDGDREAVPVLVKRLLTNLHAWDFLILEPRPYVVGEVNALLKDNCSKWVRLLAAAAKDANVGAILLVLDGDIRKVPGKAFCARDVARTLARESARARGGEQFSVGVVFACQEFESWLIAGVESLAGKRLSDGSPAVRPGVEPPQGDLEQSPRDAKGWLRNVMEAGYNPSRDQSVLTAIVDLGLVRSRSMRSFRRLEHALEQIVTAIRDASPIVSPT
jgi:hypothetical protein